MLINVGQDFNMPTHYCLQWNKQCTRKHDLKKGLTWLKCPHWPRGMVVLIKGLGHERQELLMIKTLD